MSSVEDGPFAVLRAMGLPSGEWRFRIALQIWHVDAPEGEMDWEDCPDKERYLCIADAILTMKHIS